MDPKGEIRAIADGMSQLAATPGLLNALDFDPSISYRVRELCEQMDGLFETAEDASRLLSPLGWPPMEQGNADDYAEAALLVSAGHIGDAVERLVESWNKNDAGALRLSVQRVQGLYRIVRTEYPFLMRADVGHERAKLIMEAHDNHLEGRYASAISLVFSQIDGIHTDFSDDHYAFFSRMNGQPKGDLTDDSTFAGHPDALKAIAMSLTEYCGSTEVSGRLLRHGIIHGRELGYGNLENSTKSFVTLLALISFVEKKARAKLEDAISTYEEEVAGSLEIDSDGRWKDRRGFEFAKDGLHQLDSLQERFHKRSGTYSNSIAELDPTSTFEELVGISVSKSADGSSYWGWTTPHNFTLGIGRHAGEIDSWKFGAVDPPSGLPTEPGELGWQGPLEETHSDWAIG